MRIFDYIHQGGPIMYILLLLNICGVAIMIAKAAIFRRELKCVDQTASKITEALFSSQKEKDALTKLAKQELNLYINDTEKGLNTVKIIASVSPLLGLLGTVIGVLIAFRVMSESGLSNPASFAKGISMALITTVGGMAVAIPNFIGHSYLLGGLDKLEVQLQKSIFQKIL